MLYEVITGGAGIDVLPDPLFTGWRGKHGQDDRFGEIEDVLIGVFDQPHIVVVDIVITSYSIHYTKLYESRLTPRQTGEQLKLTQTF